MKIFNADDFFLFAREYMNIKNLSSDIFGIMTSYWRLHCGGDKKPMTTDFAIKKLVEEVGEYVQESMIYGGQSRDEKFISSEIHKQKLGYELADVVCIALLNAKLYDIDIEQAIQEKWMKYKEIYEKNKN